MTEPGTGSDASGMATTARRDGNHWVLNGSKMYCSLGAKSDFIVIIATVDPALKHAGIRAFVVEKNTPGLRTLRGGKPGALGPPGMLRCEAAAACAPEFERV